MSLLPSHRLKQSADSSSSRSSSSSPASDQHLCLLTVQASVSPHLQDPSRDASGALLMPTPWIDPRWPQINIRVQAHCLPALAPGQHHNSRKVSVGDVLSVLHCFQPSAESLYFSRIEKRFL